MCMFSFALRTSWVVRSHVRCSKYGSESKKCTNKDAEGLQRPPLHIQTVKDLKNIRFSVFAIAVLFGFFLQWEWKNKICHKLPIMIYFDGTTQLQPI